MSFQVGQIGFFQLSNLLRNKIPFHFLLLDIDGETLKQYLSESKESSCEITPLLQRVKVFKQCSNKSLNKKNLSLSSLISEFKEFSFEISEPIILICLDGSLSLDLSTELSKLGYINIYQVAGGLNSLKSI